MSMDSVKNALKQITLRMYPFKQQTVVNRLYNHSIHPNFPIMSDFKQSSPFQMIDYFSVRLGLLKVGRGIKRACWSNYWINFKPPDKEFVTLQ